MITFGSYRLTTARAASAYEPDQTRLCPLRAARVPKQNAPRQTKKASQASQGPLGAPILGSAVDAGFPKLARGTKAAPRGFALHLAPPQDHS